MTIKLNTQAQVGTTEELAALMASSSEVEATLATPEVPATPATPVVKQYQVYEGHVLVRLQAGEKLFGVPSTAIHKLRVEATKASAGYRFTAVEVLISEAFSEAFNVTGFAGTFGEETATALMQLIKTGLLPEGFVSPKMLDISATGESLVAEQQNTENPKESVNMTQVNKELEKEMQEAVEAEIAKRKELEAKAEEFNKMKHALNLDEEFTTILQAGEGSVIKSKSLRLKAADKSPQVLSLQARVLDVVPFVIDNKGNVIRRLQLDALDNYQVARNYVNRANNKVVNEQIMTLSDNVVLVAIEDNKIEMMKMKESETAYILSNESAQSRIASQEKVVNVETYNSQGEVVRLRVQDATNLAVLDFNTPPLVEIPEIIKSTLFYGNGIYFRTREASANINELKGINELVQFTPSNTTPSQERQAKVTFIAQTRKLNVYDYLKEMGNEIRGYAKSSRLTIDGKEIEMFKFDVRKNSKRFGLLGSASKELKNFSKIFGKLKNRNILGKDSEGEVIEEFETSTGLKILNAPDVKGLTRQLAKVFNSDIANYSPGHKDAKPSIPAFIDWVVNLTDGGIVSDASLFGPLLTAEKLVARKRNGRLRGYAHQFRMNYQVKGLNVVAPGVKELTGYDMILFDGARKTDLLTLLEEGKELEYHVMLTASTFMEDSIAAISAQAMNNLDIDHELLSDIAKENIAKAETALNDTEKRDEVFAMMNDGKDMADMLSYRNVLSQGFGIQKFAAVNPVIWKDAYAKLEIKSEIIDFMKRHSSGSLHVNAKNNYMFTDLFAILKAVGRLKDGDMELFVKEEDLAAGQGEVVIAMMNEEGRFFYEGDIMSIRSPHVVNDETQFATAVNPLKSDNEELAKYWALWLEGGFIDGITFFSATDIMVPASSGADFDGDTSLIIIDARIIGAVERTPQYMNFHTRVTERGEWAYNFNEDGVIVGGWLLDGKLATKAERTTALNKGYDLAYTVDSRKLLGEDCPWGDEVAAPAFNLPEGMYQDGFNIYIPTDMIDSPEAYKAWIDSIHLVIGNGINTSEIGSMSNIVMAMTNGINYVKKQIEEARTVRAEEVSRLETELKYMTNMREVFVPIVWYAIDAAKHGGAYKNALKEWMNWCSTSKKIYAESQKVGNPKSMYRICGPIPNSMDAQSKQTVSVKYGVIVPNAIRAAKGQSASVKGSVPTNLQVYATTMKALVKAASEEKTKVSISQNNLRDITYAILNGSEFDTKRAKEIYAYVSKTFEEQNTALDKERRRMVLATRESAYANAIIFDELAHGKRIHMVKKMFPKYKEVDTQMKRNLAVIRQQLRMVLVKEGLDVVKFAAVAYNYAYEEAIRLENAGGNSVASAKAKIFTLWKLADELLIYMLASVEGARMLPAKEQNVFLNVKTLYFYPTDAFKTSEAYEAASLEFIKGNGKKAGKTIGLHNKEIALSGFGEGMNVYLVEKGQDATEANLIGFAKGAGIANLVPGFSYRMSNPEIANVSKTGVLLNLGVVRGFGNHYEGLAPVSAGELYDRTSMAKQKVASILFKETTMEDLKGHTKFVALNAKGTTYFGIEVDGRMKAVATAMMPLAIKDNTIFEMEGEFSDHEGVLAFYVYGYAKREQ